MAKAPGPPPAAPVVERRRLFQEGAKLLKRHCSAKSYGYRPVQRSQRPRDRFCTWT